MKRLAMGSVGNQILRISLLARALAHARDAAPTRPALAGSDPKAEAREHFRKGVAAFEDKRFGEAAEEFQAAYKLSPAFVVLYNIGEVNVALGRSVEAVDAFETYLKQGASAIPPERAREVQAEIETQLARVGTVKIEASPAGTNSTRRQAGRPLAAPPPGLQARDRGKPRDRSKSVRLPRGGQARDVDVAGRSETIVAFELVPVAPQHPDPLPRPQLPSRPAGGSGASSDVLAIDIRSFADFGRARSGSARGAAPGRTIDVLGLAAHSRAGAGARGCDDHRGGWHRCLSRSQPRERRAQSALDGDGQHAGQRLESRAVGLQRRQAAERARLDHRGNRRGSRCRRRPAVHYCPCGRKIGRGFIRALDLTGLLGSHGGGAMVRRDRPKGRRAMETSASRVMKEVRLLALAVFLPVVIGCVGGAPNKPSADAGGTGGAATGGSAGTPGAGGTAPSGGGTGGIVGGAGGTAETAGSAGGGGKAGAGAGAAGGSSSAGAGGGFAGAGGTGGGCVETCYEAAYPGTSYGNDSCSTSFDRMEPSGAMEHRAPNRISFLLLRQSVSRPRVVGTSRVPASSNRTIPSGASTPAASRRKASSEMARIAYLSHRSRIPHRRRRSSVDSNR